MTTAERIAAQAAREGIVWIQGEMEFPANEGAEVAYRQAFRVAEACGYGVRWIIPGISFEVHAPYSSGYTVLDWMHHGEEGRKLWKVTRYEEDSAYPKDAPAMVTA